jgi:hypothetical protein
VKNKYLENRFTSFFHHISEVAVTVREYNLPFKDRHQLLSEPSGWSGSSTDSDLSTSSNESPNEEPSRSALGCLVERVLDTEGLDTIIEGWKLAR